MRSGRASWQKEEETRTYFSIVLILQEKFFNSELSKVIQDAILLIFHFRTLSWFRTISTSTFITLDVQSIYTPWWIQDWYQEDKILSKRQTVFFTSVDRMNKEHKDLETVDLEAPCLARYIHTAWKKHQNTVYWVDIKFAQKNGLKFYQTRSNAIILYNTLPVYCIPKAVRMETGEVIYEKVFASPRPPPKISLNHDWMKEVGSEVARQPEDNQPTQPNPNPIYRTGRPVVTEQTSRSSAQEIDTRFSLDCKNTDLCVERLDENKEKDKDVDADRVRTDRPVGGHWSSQLEEIDIDFRVSGLPHALVKQSENFRFRELVKKIESHPHRQDLQADLQQSNTCNPFSEKSKKMIRAMGNVELFELCETIPCCAMLSMPSVLESRHSLLHLWASLERINPAEVSSDGHWIFSQSRTMSWRRCDLMAIVMGRLKNK